jgi:hypothetical protein
MEGVTMQVRTQLSVFLVNEPGTLASMCDTLAERGINILALSVSDTADYAVVRLVVDSREEAVHALGDTGVLVVENDVVTLELENEVGSLGTFAHRLRKAGINIDYAYCSAGEGQDEGMLVFRTQDPENALTALE